jgi:hypothetical protein
MRFGFSEFSKEIEKKLIYPPCKCEIGVEAPRVI